MAPRDSNMARLDAQRQELEEWVLTSYRLVAPKSLGRQVLPVD